MGNAGEFKRSVVFARIVEGKVNSIVQDDGMTFIIVRLEDKSLHDEDFPEEQLTVCQKIHMMGGGNNLNEEANNPDIGARCAVILQDPTDFTKGYYLGQLDAPFGADTRQLTNVAPGSFSTKTASGSGLHVDGKRANAALYTNQSKMEVQDHKAVMGVDASCVEVGRGGISLAYRQDTERTYGEISMHKNNLTLYNEGSVNIGALNGSVDIRGQSHLMQLGSVYELKAREVKQTTSQGRVITAGWMKYRVTSDVAFGGDGTAYEVDVLQGDIAMKTASGDVNIKTLNALQLDSIEVRVGPDVSPTFAEIFMEAPLVSGSIEISTGPLLSSIEIGNGSVTIDALTNITLDSIGTMDLKTIGSMTIEASLLNFNPTVVIASQSVVIPNPAGGPFNALATDPFTGLPHQGNVAL